MTQLNTITDPLQRARWCKNLAINVQPGISSCPHLLKCEDCEEFEDVRPPDQIPPNDYLRNQIALWIDPHAIADAIINHLGDHYDNITFEDAKDCWLFALERLFK